MSVHRLDAVSALNEATKERRAEIPPGWEDAMNEQPVLLSVDGSKGAKKALSYAIDLVRSKNAPLIVLHVQRAHGRDRIPPDLQEYERVENIWMTEADLLRGVAKNIVERAASEARKKGVTSVKTRIAEGDPAEQILKAAKSLDADAIVMGSRGLGALKGLLLGSVSHKVAHLAPCTCIVVR